jgi:hypothetical protein
LPSKIGYFFPGVQKRSEIIDSIYQVEVQIQAEVEAEAPAFA